MISGALLIAIPKFRNFQEKIPQILENVNAINSMMIISGGDQLLQLSNKLLLATWTAELSASHSLTVSQSVTNSLYRVAQKSKPLPIFQKIVLKIANEIRFLRKVKV